jgi:2-oxoglutarate ferredoxin oxidoreductase subunit delta
MATGKVIIDIDRCKGCGLCTHVCPSKILSLMLEQFNTKGHHPVSITNPEKCTGCGVCAIICPDVVFTVYRMITQSKSIPAHAIGG